MGGKKIKKNRTKMQRRGVQGYFFSFLPQAPGQIVFIKYILKKKKPEIKFP